MPEIIRIKNPHLDPAYNKVIWLFEVCYITNFLDIFLILLIFITFYYLDSFLKPLVSCGHAIFQKKNLIDGVCFVLGHVSCFNLELLVHGAARDPQYGKINYEVCM